LRHRDEPAFLARHLRVCRALSIALTLDFDSSQVVLDESKKRDWATGSLDTPSGRGVNFQVRVPAVEPVLPS